MDEENKELDAGMEVRDLSKEMRKSFLEYAMSVIVSRALPDRKSVV